VTRARARTLLLAASLLLPTSAALLPACSADKPRRPSAAGVEAPRRNGAPPSAPGSSGNGSAGRPGSTEAAKAGEGPTAPPPPPPTAATPVAASAPAAAAPDTGVLLERFPMPAGLKRVKVEKVVDGDTIWVEGGKKVRYIGINTPERGDPLYEEAKRLNGDLILGKSVYIEPDVEPTDTYGRDLGYIYTEEGLLVNAVLVQRGLAYVYRWHPNTRYADRLLVVQKEARGAHVGIWNLPTPSPERGYYADQKGHVFHRPTCASVRTIPESRRLVFQTRDEALDSGRNPDRECRP